MLYTAYRRIFLITAMLSTLIVVSISGDIGFWMATWGAGTFIIKLGDSIVSCNGPHKSTLRCIVDVLTTALSGMATAIGAMGHSKGWFKRSIEER